MFLTFHFSDHFSWKSFGFPFASALSDIHQRLDIHKILAIHQILDIHQILGIHQISDIRQILDIHQFLMIHTFKMSFSRDHFLNKSSGVPFVSHVSAAASAAAIIWYHIIWYHITSYHIISQHMLKRKWYESCSRTHIIIWSGVRST